MNPYTDDRDLRAELAPYLHADEPLLWAGQPHTTRKYHANPFVAVFMIFWLGFAVFWTVTASISGGFFGLFGIPFLLIGGYAVYTIFFGQKKRLRTTVYAVTDRRAIILCTDHRGTDCAEFIFANLSNVTMEDVQGTTGTIRFVPEQPYYRDGYSYGYGRRHRGGSVDYDLKTAFLSIDRVQEVYRLISEQIMQTK